MITYITRNIRPYGIRYHGLCYNSAPLQQLRSSRRDTVVVVRADFFDPRSVYVLDDKTNTWIEARLLREQSLRSAVGLLQDMAAFVPEKESAK
jgi:Mu transposase, C-terminal